MSTNLYDLTGGHNMAVIYTKLACGDIVQIENPYDYPGEHYAVRELDTLPDIFTPDELFERIEKV